MTTFIGRKMWAVVTDEYGRLRVKETVTTKSRKTLERETPNLVHLMTKAQVERFQQLSFFEFVKKYGKKGWKIEIYETINCIDTNH